MQHNFTCCKTELYYIYIYIKPKSNIQETYKKHHELSRHHYFHHVLSKCKIEMKFLYNNRKLKLPILIIRNLTDFIINNLYHKI